MRIRSHRSPAAALVATLHGERAHEDQEAGAAAMLHIGKVLLRIGTTTFQAMPARAVGTTSALQVLPDPTLRTLAVASAGLGAGFFLAGVPRVVVIGAIVPALAAVAAIAARPAAPAVRIVLIQPAGRWRWRMPLRGRRRD